MRDTRKPVSYFESYLQYEKSRIKHRIEKLSACDDTEKCVRRLARSPRPAKLSSRSAEIEQWHRPD